MSRIGSAIALRLSIFQPNLVTYADQVAQRSDIHRGLPQYHLDFAARHVVQLICGIKQAVYNVWHRTLPRLVSSIAFRNAFNTTLSLTWLVLMIAGAYWVRFDAPIWMGLF